MAIQFITQVLENRENDVGFAFEYWICVWILVQDNESSKFLANMPHSEFYGTKLLWALQSLLTTPSRFLHQFGLGQWLYLCLNSSVLFPLCERVWQENFAWPWKVLQRIGLQQVLATRILLTMFAQINLLCLLIPWSCLSLNFIFPLLFLICWSVAVAPSCFPGLRFLSGSPFPHRALHVYSYCIISVLPSHAA